ncbi:Trp biosynthesis-associated membrane protein [Micromonospora sp. NPDC049559]|uniref:Trp biosynthesis-associated membrane protein n=1 Tax=Micromonospora sp. NPDC049559 TaxID=3155923 RepID=UPI00343939E8
MTAGGAVAAGVPGSDARRTARRALTYAVLCCLAGAALALYAATRVWLVELTERPAPLPVLRDARTGGELLPWLPALALVGLAGGGAVLATRATARRLVGLLLLLVALGVAAGGAYGVLALDRGDGSAAWPLLCALGGLVATAGAALTAVRGQRWPTMGARYERPATSAAAPRPAEGASAGRDTRLDARRTVAAWDALDRGEDPTVGDPEP